MTETYVSYDENLKKGSKYVKSHRASDANRDRVTILPDSRKARKLEIACAAQIRMSVNSDIQNAACEVFNEFIDVELGNVIPSDVLEEKRARAGFIKTISEIAEVTSSEQRQAILAIAEMDDHTFQSLQVFLSFLRGEGVKYREPEAFYWRDDPTFRKFVQENKWEDRASKGWKRRTDVFSFIADTYVDYIGKGIARDSWHNLDDALVKRINQRASENFRDGFYQETQGVPPELKLAKREAGIPRSADDLAMLSMARIYDEVNRVRCKEYRENNSLSL